MAACEPSSDVREPVHSESDPPKLNELLDLGWKIYEEVENSTDPPGSSSVQLRVRRGMSMLQEAARMVDQLDLFSRNEDLEEVSTADLKYLLLPALLGALTMKQTSRDQRLQTVRTARECFMDFLTRCKEYNVARFELPRRRESTGAEEESQHGASAAKSGHGSADLVTMAAQRQAKIERYRQKKELEARLSDVRRAVESGQADDEVSREFYLLNVRRWISVSLEEMESIEQEEQILSNMDTLKQNKQPAQPPRSPMKPFILTKDTVQAQVFGPGYPSLPTMTVDDWYDQHRKHGALPDQGIPRRVAVEEDSDANEKDEEEKEKKAENDDEESLTKARTWDDWKDTHRRGYGNRHNMG